MHMVNIGIKLVIFDTRMLFVYHFLAF